MDLRQWADKAIAILGLGTTGQSFARLLSRYGLHFDWMDSRPAVAHLAELESQYPGCRFRLGSWQDGRLLDYDILLHSPALDWQDPALAAAREKGCLCLDDISLFAALARQPVVAITGSNGKSTVTFLTEQLLRLAGYRALACGNYGLAALDALTQTVDFYVLELSSFQLHWSRHLAPAVATVLNISDDHLDWHGSHEHYRRSKARIYHQAQRAVFNYDDKATRPADNSLPALSVGMTAAADFHLDKGCLYYRAQCLLTARQQPFGEYHNQWNLAVALALCQQLGIGLTPLLGQLESLQLLPHRCQHVHRWNQIDWYDDSKATNVAATLAAITSLRPACEGRLWLIAGGDAKGADLSPLAQALKDERLVTLTIGRDGRQIAALAREGHYLESLDKAVDYVAVHGLPGDKVLLSPACASLDQFRDYRHRGQCFAALARRLK